MSEKHKDCTGWEIEAAKPGNRAMLRVWIGYLVLSLIFSSCSIDVDQPASVTPQIEVASPSIPLQGSAGTTPPAVTTTTIPVTWSGLNLTGSLVYISPPAPGDVSYFLSIRKLNLGTGEITPVFTTTGEDWIFYISVSPDARQLLMSYTPPPQDNTVPSRAVYRIPLDDTATAQAMVSPPTPEDHYVHAEWSPDGKYIYYAHYNSNIRHPGMLEPIYDIFRMSYPEGQTEKIADNAFWPRISSDSRSLVYVSINSDSGKNELYVANADGSNPSRIVLSGSAVPEIIDAPIFSPDGESVIFSAPPPPQAYQPNWFEALMGIQVVKAHNVPSDWWSVPVTGGVPTRLTQLQTTRLFASLSPDQRHLASLSGDGIFVMDPEGSNLTQVLFDPGVSGTVSWIP
jgi:Tol biopolymer transport system component